MTTVPESSSRRQLVRAGVALALALAADTVFLGTELVPPLALAVDGLVACALFLLLGARWSLVPVLLVEVFPATAMFPTWTLAVVSLALLDRRRR